jgi:hypothetical protein
MCAKRCQKHNHVFLSKYFEAWATRLAEKALHVCRCHASNFTLQQLNITYCSLPQCTSMLNTQRGAAHHSALQPIWMSCGLCTLPCLVQQQAAAALATAGALHGAMPFTPIIPVKMVQNYVLQP